MLVGTIFFRGPAIIFGFGFVLGQKLNQGKVFVGEVNRITAGSVLHFKAGQVKNQYNAEQRNDVQACHKGAEAKREQ